MDNIRNEFRTSVTPHKKIHNTADLVQVVINDCWRYDLLYRGTVEIHPYYPNGKDGANVEFPTMFIYNIFNDVPSKSSLYRDYDPKETELMTMVFVCETVCCMVSTCPVYKEYLVHRGDGRTRSVIYIPVEENYHIHHVHQMEPKEGEYDRSI